MTGLNILALLGKNTTTTVEQKFHNGKNQKSGLKGIALNLIEPYFSFFIL